MEAPTVDAKASMTPDHSAQPAEGVEALPKLPAPQKECWLGHQLFSAEQMHEYARRTLAASRGEAVAWGQVFGGKVQQATTSRKTAFDLLEGDEPRNGRDAGHAYIVPLYTTPTPDARVRELVAKWRAEADADDKLSSERFADGDRATAALRLGCATIGREHADELAAALAAMDQETE